MFAISGALMVGRKSMHLFGVLTAVGGSTHQIVLPGARPIFH